MDLSSIVVTTVTPAIQEIIQNAILYMPKLALAAAVLFIGFKIHPFFSDALKRFFDKQPYDESLEKFIQSLLEIGYKAIIVIIAVSIAGIETASIVAALGAAGFAVGLALQGSMSNFASGILVLMLKPIKVGEYIEIKGFAGTVHKIDIFNTVLLTLDNKTIIVPNSDITSNILTNYSRQQLRRVDLSVGVGYDSDLAKVEKVLRKIISKHEDLTHINEEKPVIIRAEEFGDSAITVGIYIWVQASNYIALKSALIPEIKTAFEKNKIEIPYPTVSIKK